MHTRSITRACVLLLACCHDGVAADSKSTPRAAPVFERHAFPLPQNIPAVEAMDANGDGKRDLIAVGPTKVWALLAPNWKVVELADTAGGGTINAIALDGDGDMDAAGCSFTQMTVRWWENLGGGKFQPHEIDTGNQQWAYDLKIADVDGDGRPDILLAGRQSKNVVWYRQR